MVCLVGAEDAGAATSPSKVCTIYGVVGTIRLLVGILLYS